MKADKAPEKIYIHEASASELTEKLPYHIEYIRTDAFIEKVESFLNRKDDRDYYTIGYIKRHLEEIVKEIGL